MNALAKKLMMKPGSRWLLFNAPAGYTNLLQPLPEGLIVADALNGDFNGVQLFVQNSADLADNLKVLTPAFKGDIIFWVTYPKKSSGMASDLEMMGNWDILATYGFNGIAAASVDTTWTALRFRQKEFSKTSDTCNDEIPKNDYSQYIDIASKQVTLPPDAATALQNNPFAMTKYQSLSYSNRKEYVLWILTARQEKTRLERLAKMVEKLLAGKKNPAEK